MYTRKFILALIVLCFVTIKMSAQLAGSYTVPGSFPTLAAAVSSLNAGGITGSVTINVLAGYTETVPVLGLSLTATGTSLNPIVFQKSGTGANPLLTGYIGGSGTPSTSVQDGIWRFLGCDFITIDGIDLVDPNTSNPETMEFGFGFFKTSGTDGCNDNTIKNCAITLNRANLGVGLGTSVQGSRAIEFVNASSSSHSSSIVITSADGASSNNVIHNNRIQNCNVGVALIGFQDSSPFAYVDRNNTVGGGLASMSNTIVNYGGGTGPFGSAFPNPAAAVKTFAQYDLNVSHNFINNNNGGGSHHLYHLYGMQIQAATSADVTVTNNTITLKSGCVSSSHRQFAINNDAGSSPAGNLVNLSGNLITGSTWTTAVTGTLNSIYNSASPSTLIISNNIISNNLNAANHGGFTIRNQGEASFIHIDNNAILNYSLTTTASGTSYFSIFNQVYAGGTFLSISSNTMQGLEISAGLQYKFIDNTFHAGATSSVVINGNSFGNFNGPVGTTRFIQDFSSATNFSCQANIVSNFTNTATGPFYGISTSGTTQPGSNMVLSSNTVANISVSGSAYCIGYGRSGASRTLTAQNNLVTNILNHANDITGIAIGSAGACLIENNVVSHLVAADRIHGMSLSDQSGTVTLNTIGSLTCTGADEIIGLLQGGNGFSNIYKNKIYDLQASAGSGTVTGLKLTTMAGISNGANIYNNFIGDLKTPSAINPNAIRGLSILSGGQATVNLYFNTVRIAASSTGSLFGTSAIYTNTIAPLHLKNNIFINLSVPSGSGVTTVLRMEGAGISNYTSTSNNNLFYAGVPAAGNAIFVSPSGTFQTFSAFKAFVSPRESASVSSDVSFLSVLGTSQNFLHCSTPSTAESRGINIGGVTDDYDGDIRHGNFGYSASGLAPDIGADEFNTPNCATVNAVGILSSLAPSVCAGQSVTITRDEYMIVPGVQQQWQMSNTAGGPYTLIPAAHGTTFITPTLSPGTYYFTSANSCSFTNQTAASNEVTVSVFSFPSLTVSPLTATFCSGSSPVILTTTGAPNYSWAPSSGLNSTTLAIISASPASTTAYTVTGINPGNCTSTETVLVTRLPAAGTITALPSSTTICQGANVNLQAIATTTIYTVTPITYAPISTPTAGVGTFCNNGTVVTSMSSGNLDDGNWYIVTLPFSFTFYSIAYTGISISTNGFITFGNVVPNTHSGYGLPLPAFSAGRPCAGAVYANLDFTNAGIINTFTTGTSPNRKRVINWAGGRFFNGSSGTGTVTTQIVLHESTNYIDVHTAISTGQLPAVEGIQNANSSAACTVPNRNAQTFTITNESYRFRTALNVSWTPTTNLSNPNNSLTIAQNLQAGITYTAVGLAANGCTIGAPVTISVNPSPTLAITGATVPVCDGATVNLTATGTDSVNWGSAGTGTSIVVSPSVTTAYVATGTWTVNNCIANATHIVTVNPNPTVTITGNTFICDGQTATLSANGASSYSWSSGSTSSVIIDSPTSTIVYSVTGTSTAGCESYASHSLAVYPNPTLSTVVNPTVVCAGAGATLSAIGADTYSWSTGASGTPLLVWPASTSIYTVTGTNNNGGCQDQAVISLSVNPNPTVAISGGSTSFCAGQTVTLTASGASTYSWSLGGTSPLITVTPSVTSTFAVVGTDTLTNCSGQASQIVVIVPHPTVVISGTTALCVGKNVLLTATGASSYTWSTGATQTGINVSPTINTVYTATGVTGPNCVGSGSVSIQVHPLPVTAIVAAPATTLCEGESIELSATAGAGQSLLWSSGSSLATITVTPAATTIFSVTITNGATGCANSASVQIMVDPCTGISYYQNGEIRVLPNPFSGSFTVDNKNDATANYEVLDVSGRTILRGVLPIGLTVIHLETMAKGVYYFRAGVQWHVMVSE